MAAAAWSLSRAQDGGDHVAGATGSPLPPFGPHASSHSPGPRSEGGGIRGAAPDWQITAAPVPYNQWERNSMCEPFPNAQFNQPCSAGKDNKQKNRRVHLSCYSTMRHSLGGKSCLPLHRTAAPVKNPWPSRHHSTWPERASRYTLIRCPACLTAACGPGAPGRYCCQPGGQPHWGMTQGCSPCSEATAAPCLLAGPVPPLLH